MNGLGGGERSRDEAFFEVGAFANDAPRFLHETGRVVVVFDRF